MEIVVKKGECDDGKSKGGNGKSAGGEKVGER